MRHMIQYVLVPIFFVVLFVCTSSMSYGQDTIQVRKTELFPNPFSSALTIIPHKIPDDIREISIYDPLGNLVHSFGEEDWQQTEFKWNGQSSTGGTLTRGTYIFLIRTKDKSESLLVQKQ